jgi:hypothetical protein
LASPVPVADQLADCRFRASQLIPGALSENARAGLWIELPTYRGFHEVGQAGADGGREARGRTSIRAKRVRVVGCELLEGACGTAQQCGHVISDPFGDAGQLPDGIDPDDLAVTLLATLQGGLLLAQVQRDSRPLETALDTVLELAWASGRDRAA